MDDSFSWFGLGLSVLMLPAIWLFVWAANKYEDWKEARRARQTDGNAQASGGSMTAMPRHRGGNAQASGGNAQASGGNAQALTAPLFAALTSGKPHLLIVGHTGGGKSVLVRALVKHLVDSGAQVVALDPDAAPRHYPRPAQLLSDDAQWLAAVDGVVALFTARNEEYKQGREKFTPLWLVADECQELLAIEGVLTPLMRILRRGRKLNIHLVLAVQDSQVRTLGIERRSHLLVNLSRVELTREGDTRIAAIDGTRYVTPPLPLAYDGDGRGKVIPLPATPAIPQTQWTERHVITAALLATNPALSGRELTRKIYPGSDGTGKAAALTKRIRQEVSDIMKGGNADEELL